MPFQSQAQRAFMYANHPDIAKRWEQLTPKDHKLPQHVRQETSESHETWKPAVAKLPRHPGAKRDFSHLTPSQSARHVPANKPRPNEIEAMKEEPVQFIHGSRHEELGTPKRKIGQAHRAAEKAIVPRKAGA